MNGNYGTNVKVERSTYDTSPRIWMFIRNSEHGPVKGVLNLDRSQAKELIEELEGFVNS